MRDASSHVEDVTRRPMAGGRAGGGLERGVKPRPGLSLSDEVFAMLFILVLSLVIPLSLSIWVVSLVMNTAYDGTLYPISPWRLLFAIIAPMFITIRGLKKQSLDMSGALTGFVVGFVLTVSNLCFFSCLLAFFGISSWATKYKAEKKRVLEEDFKEGGQRNWIQVLCNGGVATELAILYMIEFHPGETVIDFNTRYNACWLVLAVVAGLASSCGDTLSSELGTVLGGQPKLITTWQPVPKGTNGGVTGVGLACSLLGGLAVGVAYYLTILLTNEPVSDSVYQWPMVLYAGAAGLLGSLLDSFLGATLQYSGFCDEQKKVVQYPSPTTKHISGLPLLDNHGVNLVTCVVISLTMPRLGYQLWPY
ncbi:transmembrane protein 19-like [Branchiostoma lanceolatum]|uniref:transmembrane protein 19-like n=1 Tax=Branchiostoma lanceolatum TaxID=7740 RepID=UPI003455F3A0